jgi:hypothetical protein
MGGTESVEDLISAGLVKHIPVPSFPAFEKAVVGLLPTVGPEDVVILDTLSTMGNTTRGDFRLGVDETELWSKRGLYFGGDKNFLTQYEAAEKMIMRQLKNLRAKGCRIVTITHEDEQTDPITMTKKRAPQLNQAFYGSLMAHSTDVFRLSMFTEAVTNKSGEVVVKAGTRVLYLTPADGVDGHVTKYHVPRSVAETLPKGLTDPTMPKLFDTLKKKPGWLVIYGPPGVGKTTLACSEAQLTAVKKGSK